MKTFSSICLLLIFSAIAMPDTGRTQDLEVRPPAWSGKFYPASASELTRVIEDFAEAAETTPIELPQNQGLRAVILPHAGYIYSGWTAAHVSRVLDPKAFETVVVMAPDHRVGFSGGVISAVDAYRTPLGLLRMSPSAAVLREQYDFFASKRFSDETEHAVEVVLPMLQHFLGAFELIPMVLGPCPIEAVAQAVMPLLNRDTLLVVSSDLSHYLPYDQACARDRRTLETILALDGEHLARQENAACGKGPIRVLLHIARQLGWTPVLLHYSNSGDTAGDRQRVVGYAAVAFYEHGPPQTGRSGPRHFTAEQGRHLVDLARLTIEAALSDEQSRAAAATLQDRLAHSRAYEERCGTFVTLKRNHRLRGCIGNLNADMSILDSIRTNALGAAFHDPRFPPLNPNELNGLDIEVSILSRPEPLPFKDGGDLISKLRIHEDGVVIRKGTAAATFLPQVWQELPDPESFMSRLCLKAGLAADAWQRQPLEVMTYQVQHFNEKQ